MNVRRLRRIDTPFPSRLFSALAVSTVVAHGDDLRVTHWDGNAEQLFGRHAADVLGRRLVDVLTPRGAAPDIRDALRYVGATGREWEGSVDARHADDRVVAVHVRLSPLWDGATVAGVIGVAVPVAQEQRDSDLARFTLHDPLTGLANRILLRDRLDLAVARLPRSPHALAVLFVDLDRFKELNDRLGHAAGDAFLVSVAGALHGAVRPGDTVARFGGDEFVVVCESVEPGAEADLAERLIETVAALPVPLGGPAITVSVGVSVSDAARTDAFTLLRHADAAMYRAKQRGGATWERSSVSGGGAARTRASDGTARGAHARRRRPPHPPRPSPD